MGTGLFSLPEDNRREWQYQTPKGLRRIVDDGNGAWTLHFPNGTTAELKELSRTEQYVELQNVKNKNIQRLFTKEGRMQPKGVGPFRKFADGMWMKPDPAADGYKVQLVYFVPSDRKPCRDYEKRIRLIASLLAEIFTDDLRSKGFTTDGPQFVENESGEFTVTLLTGEQTARAYNHLPTKKSLQHSKAVFAEVDRRLNTATTSNIVVIFSETYEEGPASQVWPGHLAVALARPPKAGICMFSSWILRDEFSAGSVEELRNLFFDTRPIRGRTAIGHKGPNSPRNEFLEDGIGGLLHELAHCLGPTHDLSKPTNIMGQGFRDLRWNVGVKSNRRKKAAFSRDTAAIMMASRFLNPKVDRSDNTRPTAHMSFKKDGKNAVAVIDVADDKALSLVALVEVTKTKGRQLIELRKLSGKSETVRIKLNARNVTTGPNAQLQAILIDGGGNHRKVNGSLSNLR
jgi:hypothetical protein